MNASRIAATQHMSTLEVLALPAGDYVLLAAGHNAHVRDRNAAARSASRASG